MTTDTTTLLAILKHAKEGLEFAKACLGYEGNIAALDSTIKGIDAAIASNATEPETMTLQEIWNAAGGNPGITPTKQDVLDALKAMDEAVDEADATEPTAQSELINKLQSLIEDPMWANHAEVSKSLLQEVCDKLATVPDYEAMECEHMGDPDKQTGIYHPDVIAIASLAQPTGDAAGEPEGWLYDFVHQSTLGKPDKHYTMFTEDRETAYKADRTNQRLVYAAPKAAQPEAWPSIVSDYKALEADWNALMDALECNDTKSALTKIKGKPGYVQVPDGWAQAVEWLRNNYQDHANIADLCEAMIAAAPKVNEQATAAIEGKV